MIDYFLRHWQSLLPPAIVFAAVFVTDWFLRLLLFRLLSRWAKITPARWDDLAVGVLRRPSLLWLAMPGLPVTPILTALSVGGLAVALALQDRLSNLFSDTGQQPHRDSQRQTGPGDRHQLPSAREENVAFHAYRGEL